MCHCWTLSWLLSCSAFKLAKHSAISDKQRAGFSPSDSQAFPFHMLCTQTTIHSSFTPVKMQVPLNPAYLPTVVTGRKKKKTEEHHHRHSFACHRKCHIIIHSEQSRQVSALWPFLPYPSIKSCQVCSVDREHILALWLHMHPLCCFHLPVPQALEVLK